MPNYPQPQPQPMKSVNPFDIGNDPAPAQASAVSLFSFLLSYNPQRFGDILGFLYQIRSLRCDPSCNMALIYISFLGLIFRAFKIWFGIWYYGVKNLRPCSLVENLMTYDQTSFTTYAKYQLPSQHFIYLLIQSSLTEHKEFMWECLSL